MEGDGSADGQGAPSPDATEAPGSADAPPNPSDAGRPLQVDAPIVVPAGEAGAPEAGPADAPPTPAAPCSLANCPAPDNACVAANVCAAIDQRQDRAMANSPNQAPEEDAAVHNEIAQIVKVGKSGRLVAIRLHFFCNPGGHLVVEVRETAPGRFAPVAPSATVLASQIVDPADYPQAGPLLRTIVFKDPVPLSAGTNVALVFRGASPPVCDIFFYDGNPYPEGQSLTYQPGYTGDWGPSGGISVEQDLAFETLIAP